jgi:outer membrane protein
MKYFNIQLQGRLIFLSTLFLLINTSTFAQEILTLDEAIKIAQSQNQSIKIAQQTAEIAGLQVYKGNAGMKPRIDFNTNVGSALNNVKQKLSNGTEILRPNGQSITPNTNVALQWTLYDGRRMNAVFERLGQQSELRQFETKQVSEQITAAVSRAYFEIIRQKLTEKNLLTIIGYYEEKKRIAEERWNVGRGSKLDFLQSSVDLNNQKADLLRVQNALKNAKTALNGILERDLTLEYEVSDFPMAKIAGLNLDEIKERAKQNNKDLILNQKNIGISKVLEKEAEALKKPRVFLNSGYGYALNSSNAGFILLNQNLGLNATIGATWNIYNGEQTRRNVQISKLNTKILESREDDIWSQISSTIRRNFNQYQTDSQVLDLEKQNLTLAEENLKIALEKFKLGASTILELNQAQQSYDQTANRIINSEYNIKISELEILRVSGSLGL